MAHKIASFILIAFLAAPFLFGGDQQQPQATEKAAARQFEPGRIEQVSPQSMSVRVGDATTTYTFDNKTVFTYGDHQATAQDLKIGDEVLVSGGKKGKAVKVNVTERIEGVIEKINTQEQKLTVKFGETIKEIPFSFFVVMTPDGNPATLGDMKEGDAVLLNVNVGFAGGHQ